MPAETGASAASEARTLWPAGERVGRELQLPPDIYARAMERRDIPTVIALLGDAFPDLAIAEDRSVLDVAFYEEQVAFAGEGRYMEERPLYVLLLESASRTLACILVEYEADARALLGRLAAVTPAARGKGLGLALLEAQIVVGRAVGAIHTYGLAALDNRTQCALLARSGFTLCAIIPDSERRQGAHGELRFVSEALYMKVLVPPDALTWPEPAALRPGTAALMRLLFGRTEASASPPRARASIPGASESLPTPTRADDPWPGAASCMSGSSAGPTLRPLARADVPRLLARLPNWDLELTASLHAHLLAEPFYEQHVALADEDATIDRRPSRVIVIEIEGELAGAAWLTCDLPSSTLRLELAAVELRRRRQGLARALVAEFVALGRALGVETLLSAVTMRHPHGQRALELAGFTPIGIIPVSERRAVASDVYRYEYHALYAISRVPSALSLWPVRAAMLPAVADLAELVFGAADSAFLAR